MRAERAYRLIVRRGGLAPSWIANPQRVDHVEVVELDSNEVVLFWDCDPGVTKRLVRRLRQDLTDLDAEQFVAAWRDTQATDGDDAG
jgi:hypothetical protein